jgi:hypothetical protein
MTEEEMFEAARNGTLPSDFDDWDAEDEYGETVAHAAAKAGTLPSGFGAWELEDDMGVTVAHAAAVAGTLPPDFDRWDIRSKNLTVSELAVRLKPMMSPRSWTWTQAHLTTMIKEALSGNEIDAYEEIIVPSRIEAVRLYLCNLPKVAAWLTWHGGHPYSAGRDSESVQVDMPMGTVTAKVGDWIVRDSEGFRVISNARFRKTYKRVGKGRR